MAQIILIYRTKYIQVWILPDGGWDGDNESHDHDFMTVRGQR